MFSVTLLIKYVENYSIKLFICNAALGVTEMKFT